MASSRRGSLRSLAALLLLAGCGGASPPADLVIRNAALFTAVGGADAEVIADGAVAVRGSRIIYVGSDRGVSALIGEATEVIDGSGGMVLPGFVDSHAHPYSGTERLECDLSGDSTVAQLHDSIRRCAVARPRAAWLRGTGWQLPVFPDANPLRQQLDSLVSDRPAFLVAADGHSAWVNSAALGRAGITAATPDPANGRIERDERGNPSGTLRESAMDLVARLIPPYTAEDHVRGFQAAFAEAVGFGITAMVDADADSAMLEAYRLMDSAGTLPVRISAAQHLGPGSVADLVSRVQRFRDRYSSPLVSANGAKIFMDGVIEARTAALLEPYLDRAGDRGQPSLPQARLDSLVRELDRLGVQVHVHAIGDRAIRMTLDAFERAAQQNGTGDRRHQIAHLELIDPADIGRFMRLGVIANFQPLWAYDDSYIVELTIPALGAARSRWLYPLRSVLATGATVTAGSDWSVSSMDPLEAIQVGVTRRALDAGPGPGWIPQEQARLQDLLAAYTIVGAFGRRAEGSTGSLEAGKLADLVLLDRNLFQVPPHQLAEARVLLTVMDGRVRFRRPAAR